MKKPFEEIVTRHGATVLRVCRAVVGVVDADDAWSETFLSALEAYPRLPDDANVEAWLVTIAHRKAIDVTRTRPAREPCPSPMCPDRPSRPAERPDIDLVRSPSPRCPTSSATPSSTTTWPACPTAKSRPIIGGTADAARRVGRRRHRQARAKTLPMTPSPAKQNLDELFDTYRRAAADATFASCTIGWPKPPTSRASSTSPTARSTRPSGHCSSRRRRRSRPRRLRAARATTPCSQTLATRISPRILDAPKRLDAAAHEIDEYFAGRRQRSTCRWTSVWRAGFRRAVLTHLPDIAYGQRRAMPPWPRRPETRRPCARSARPARQPVADRVPCHRVVRSDGRRRLPRRPGTKRLLLDLEAA